MKCLDVTWELSRRVQLRCNMEDLVGCWTSITCRGSDVDDLTLLFFANPQAMFAVKTLPVSVTFSLGHIFTLQSRKHSGIVFTESSFVAFRCLWSLCSSFLSIKFIQSVSEVLSSAFFSLWMDSNGLSSASWMHLLQMSVRTIHEGYVQVILIISFSRAAEVICCSDWGNTLSAASSTATKRFSY